MSFTIKSSTGSPNCTVNVSKEKPGRTSIIFNDVEGGMVSNIPVTAAVSALGFPSVSSMVFAGMNTVTSPSELPRFTSNVKLLSLILVMFVA